MRKYSIVIPVYNTPEEYFRVCMESVLKQSYEDLEVILVDDGSMQSVRRLCDEYGEKDGRVIVVHQKNYGVSAARNVGMDRAEGDYLFFLDPDDWIDKEMLEYVDNWLEKESVQCLMFGFMTHWYDHTTLTEMGNQAFERLTIEECKKMQIGLLDETRRKYSACFGSACLTIFDRIWMMETKVKFNIEMKMDEDLYFMLQLLEHNPAVMALNRPFYHYRKHNSSVMNKYNPKIIEDRGKSIYILYCFVKNKEKSFLDAFAYKAMRTIFQMMEQYFCNSNCNVSYRERKQEWNQFINEMCNKTCLEKSDSRALYRENKIFGAIHYFAFRRKKFGMVILSFHLFKTKRKIGRWMGKRGK